MAFSRKLRAQQGVAGASRFSPRTIGGTAAGSTLSTPPGGPAPFNQLYTRGYFPELSSTTLLGATVVAGKLMVAKDNGLLPSELSSAATTYDFGQAMTPNDFILLKNEDQEEWIQVGSLVTGTEYNISRDEAGGGANPKTWTWNAPYILLGYDGDGWLVLDAESTPKFRIYLTGTTWDGETCVAAMGDLDGVAGVSGEVYGLFAGDYAGGNYILYRTDTGFVLSAGAGGVRIDALGISIVAGPASDDLTAYKFIDSSDDVYGGLYGYDSGATTFNLDLRNAPVQARNVQTYLYTTALASAPGDSAITLIESEAQGPAKFARLRIRANTSESSFTLSGSAGTYVELLANVGINTASFGTNAAAVLALKSGTAPTTSPADTVQLWESDQGAVAGRGSLNIRVEDGTRGILGRALWWGLTAGGLTGAGDIEAAGQIKAGNTTLILGANNLVLNKGLTIANTNAGTLDFTAASKTLSINQSLALDGTSGKSLTLTNSLTVSGNDGTISFGATSKTLTISQSLTLTGTSGKALTLTGGLTIGADTTINGGGTVSLGGFTLTVPATGTAALLGTAQTFSAAQTISAGLNLGSAASAGTGTLRYSGELEALRGGVYYTGALPIPLPVPLTSANWDGNDTKVVTAGTAINVNTEFGVPSGAKYVELFVAGTWAAASNASSFSLRSTSGSANVGSIRAQTTSQQDAQIRVPVVSDQIFYVVANAQCTNMTMRVLEYGM